MNDLEFKVLFVDDDLNMQETVVSFLLESKVQVVSAFDGATGIQLAKEQKFDLVLTDVNMPLMDGITLTRELRALPAYRFVPILMLTTEAGQERKLEGKAAGATGWIVKPFNPDQLIAVVKKVLG